MAVSHKTKTHLKVSSSLPATNLQSLPVTHPVTHCRDDGPAPASMQLPYCSSVSTAFWLQVAHWKGMLHGYTNIAQMYHTRYLTASTHISLPVILTFFTGFVLSSIWLSRLSFIPILDIEKKKK